MSTPTLDTAIPLTPLAVTVTRVIDAAPGTVYDLISDVTQMSRYSPETVAIQWLDGADGAVVGARFKGRNKINWARWTTKPTITAAERGAVFAFQVPGTGGPLWTYRLAAVDGGTLVTESMQQTEISPAVVRFIQRRAGAVDRAAHLRAGMTATLARLAAAAVAAEAAVAR